MDNILLGKTVKAMYKLSGKTLTQLSDETDLTVDTINNLFYARLQKPSFIGVSSIVKATGYTISDLSDFMEIAKELPEDADFTEEFTKFIFSVKDTDGSVPATKGCPKHTGDIDTNECCLQIQTLNEEHEKQLDRFRATHLHYVEEVHTLYKQQIAQMEENTQRLKNHYDHSVGEIKKAHAAEIERQDKEIKELKKFGIGMLIVAALIAVGAVVIVLTMKG